MNEFYTLTDNVKNIVYYPLFLLFVDFSIPKMFSMFEIETHGTFIGGAVCFYYCIYAKYVEFGNVNI